MPAWKQLCDAFEDALMTEDYGQTFCSFSTKIIAEIKKPHFDGKMSEEFDRASTKNDVTSLLLDSPALRPLLALPAENFAPDDNAAEALRESGNSLFKQCQFKEALTTYNNSILHCQREPSAGRQISKCLSLSYGNRSAALYQLGELRACLADIDAAITFAYPADMVHKLHERKVRCLLRLQQYSAAAEAIAATRESLSTSTLAEKEKQVIRNLLDSHAHSCTARTTTVPDVATNSSSSYPSPPPLSYGTSDKYAALSAAVEVVENSRYGKHVICKQKIEVGDIVAVEEPLVAVPLPTSLTTHCYFCLQRYGAAFYPCRRCHVALYCSLKCESRCWSNYHRYECYKMSALTSCGHHLGHAALRATLVAGLIHYTSHAAADIATRNKNFTESRGCAQCPLGYNYLLRQGIPREKSSISNALCLPVLAVYLALCTNPEVADLIPSGATLGKSYLHAVAAVNFTHLLAFENRSHFVYETSIGLLRCDATRTASAIYPLINLFNHSCSASVYRTYHGSKAVMRSVCSMQPGDQVFDCYGAYYMGMSRQERRLRLSNYSFLCECIACAGDWPTKVVLSHQAEVNRLPACVHKADWSVGKRQCPLCLGKLSALASKLARVAIRPDSGGDQKLIKTLTTILAELYNIALQPHILFVECREKLTFVFDLMGNSHRV